jgi:hypothetical protein
VKGETGIKIFHLSPFTFHHKKAPLSAELCFEYGGWVSEKFRTCATYGHIPGGARWVIHLSAKHKPGNVKSGKSADFDDNCPY